MTNDYRVARQAQDAKYEDVTGLSVADTDRQEYRDYFGIGDHAGTPVEKRVTPHEWLIEQAHEREPVSCVTESVAFELSGRQLAVLAAAGDYVAKDEIVRRALKRHGLEMAA